MKKPLYILSLLLLCSNLLLAQFAPQALLQGSTAIYKDSSIIQSWADHGVINRGWLNIADTSLGKVGILDSNYIHGKADGNIVSLGDGGEVIYHFSNPIINGDGFDFAIFENGFRNPADSNEAFLELAKVFVSSNGIDYFEFPSVSLTDTINQIPGFGTYMDCRKIDNLAGKYIQGFGTAFDLSDLLPASTLDINQIQFVKIKDVVGTLLQDYCTKDLNLSKINDPYPTPFPSAGFDLDALGIIHQKYPTSVQLLQEEPICIVYPNPALDEIHFKTSKTITSLFIHSVDGKLVFHANTPWQTFANIKHLPKGFYLIELVTADNYHFKSSFVK